VCARELPGDFIPPAPSTGANDAEAAEQSLHNELDGCRRATARAEATFESRASEEASVAVQLGNAVTAVADAECQLASEEDASGEDVFAAADATRARLEQAQRAERADSDSLVQARADVSATEGAIEALSATTQRAASALARATSDRDEAAETSDRCRDAFVEAGGNDALSTAQTDLTTTAETLANGKSPLDAAERSVDDAETRLNSTGRRAAALGAAQASAISHSRAAMEAVRAAVTTIPAAARQGANDDPLAVAETAERWVADRRVFIAEAAQRQKDAEAAFELAQSSAKILRTRQTAELERPLGEARSAGTRLAAIAEVSSPAADLGPAGLAAWATAAAAETRQRAEDCNREADAADAEANRARAAALAACEEAAVERGLLDRWRAEIQSEVGAANEVRDQAAARAERACTLDAVLAASADRSRLLGLARELCQGRESFANHVLVARRQGLIAEAAAILIELSGGRLTFAEDVAATFSVLDTGTGSVRDPRLLSGGEQFQASLALALGLVEIAARAGSRIECLFLDEGFGALDPASLDTALDALESAARRGRRIVAVTHVDAVTARADQVLGVAGSESGSHAAWRGTELGAMV
jgi:DNA repair protein SbcC/Rad50